MSGCSLDLREKVVESVRKGVAEFLFAVSRVSVSEATVCRAVGRVRRSRKKDQEALQKETSS
jgi:hypothetical protein